MRQWIGSASTLEEAILIGLKALGLSREQVNVEVLEERASGLLSMMGFRRVRVKLMEKEAGGGRRPAPNERHDGDRDRFRRSSEGRPDFRRRGEDRPSEGRSDFRRRDDRPRDNRPRDDRPRDDRPRDNRNRPPQDRRPDDRPRDNRGPFPGRRSENRPAAPTRPPVEENLPPMAAGVPVKLPPTPEELLTQWKEWAGWNDLSWEILPAEGNALPITLKTAQHDKLFGSGGQTLEGFEYLVNIILNRTSKDRPRVVFELEGHVNPRKQAAIDEAHRAANEVRRTGRVYRLEPMNSAERRLVHQTLANEADVETASEGEGPFRKVVVRPKQGAGTGSAKA